MPLIELDRLMFNRPLPPDQRLAAMISTLRINYYIHRMMEFLGISLSFTNLLLVVLFIFVGEKSLAIVSALNGFASLQWSGRMSGHVTKAKDAYDDKLQEYERLYGKLT